MRILLDMDELLSDFVGGACREWGKTAAEVEQHWEPGRWDIVPPLAAALGEPLTDLAFWDRLHNRAEFWAGLDPLPWVDELVDAAARWTDDWWVVTSPSHCPSSYYGKAQWLKRQFGRRFDRFHLTPHKHLFARADTLLIDDRDDNVDRFIAAGGKGLVFPRHHNSQHRHKGDPLKYVLAKLHPIMTGDADADHNP